MSTAVATDGVLDRESQSGRRHVRHAVDVEITLESEHNFYAGFVENVSVSGLFVATHTLHPIGSRLDFSIRLRGEEEPLVGVGEVRWTRQYSDTSDTPPGVGLRFVELAGTSQERIEEFVRTRSPLFFDDETAH